MAGPLAGVHVLDLARVLAGPYAAMLLGDLDYNTYNNTFGPYGAFQVNAAGIEQQMYVMSAPVLAAATP